MSVSIIIMNWGGEPLSHFLKELGNEKKIRPELYLESISEYIASEAIVPGSPQILVVGQSVEENIFTLKMKSKSPELIVVRFAFYSMEGRPKPPYDIFVTWAHPANTYKEFIEEVLLKFLSKHHRL